MSFDAFSFDQGSFDTFEFDTNDFEENESEDGETIVSTVYYRMTIYDAPLYSSDTTILTPASGSSHTDSFRVTTHPSLSGWQPYMRIPKGERGSFDVRKGTSTVGSYKVTLLDKKTSNDNIHRWVTAFIGDSGNRMSLIGKKAYLEESLDNGSTWSPFFVGRISELNLASLLQVSFTIADSLDLLKQNVFETIPTVDYVSFRSIFPLGFMNDIVSSDSGSIISAQDPFIIDSGYRNDATGHQVIKMSALALNDPRNRWGFGAKYDVGRFYHTEKNQYRAKITSGSNEYHYAVFRVTSTNDTFNKNNTNVISYVWVGELDANDPQYAPLGAITGSVQGNGIWIYHVDPEKYGFMLNVSPYKLTRDILGGYYFPYGTSRAISYDSASLATLETTKELPHTLYRVSGKSEAAKYIEENICKPFQIGYTVEPTLSGSVPVSQLRFFNTQQPTTLAGVPTLSGSYIIAGSSREWRAGEPTLYLQGTFYMEQLRGNGDDFSDSKFDPLIETDHPIIYPFGQNTDDPTRHIETINFVGLRGLDNTTSGQYSGQSLDHVTSYQYFLDQTKKLLQSHWLRHRHGNPVVRLSTIRNSDTESIRVGDFCIVEAETLPNQATHTRGGTRVMQVTQKVPLGVTCEWELIDAGVNDVMNAPTLGTLTRDTGSVFFDVTTSENADVEVEYAVTAFGGSVPNTASRAWLLSDTYNINDTTLALSIEGLPEGKQVFVRVRAVSPIGSDMKLPSLWQVSSGEDLSSITAPTSVNVTDITSRSAKVTWTNTQSEYEIELWLASPAGTPTTLITVLPAGSTTYTLKGLNKNSDTSHRVGVRYSTGVNGNSAFATADFNATGVAPTLDAPAALVIYNQR